MKKLLSLWSMTVLLLFGAIAVTSCGGDDDDDFSDKKDDKEKSIDDDPTKAISAGYYAFEYEVDGKKLYGNLDLELYYDTRDAAAAGDTGYFTEKLFKEHYSDALGAYIYVKNGKRYVMTLWENITQMKTDYTYNSRTYSYPGGELTVYFNISSVDADRLELITSSSGYTYSNGYLDYKDNYNKTTRYKRLDFNKKFDWIEEYCSKEVDKLNGDY